MTDEPTPADDTAAHVADQFRQSFARHLAVVMEHGMDAQIERLTDIAERFERKDAEMSDEQQGITAFTDTEQSTFSDDSLMIVVLPVAEPILEVSVKSPFDTMPPTVSLRGIRKDLGVDASVQNEDALHRLLEKLAPAIVKSLIRGSAIVIASRPISNFSRSTTPTANQLSEGGGE